MSERARVRRFSWVPGQGYVEVVEVAAPPLESPFTVAWFKTEEKR